MSAAESRIALTADDLQCSGCGYPLRGLPHHVCPECGCAFDPALMLAHLREGNRPTPATARDFALISCGIALLSVICTPFLGLMAIENVVSSRGSCGRSGQDETMFFFIFILVLTIPGGSLATAMRASAWVATARAAALATFTAWITMWVLVWSV